MTLRDVRNLRIRPHATRGVPTPIRWMIRLGVVVLMLIVAACSGPPANAPEQPANAQAAPVGMFSSANPGSVNTYWISGPQGLVLIDALRTLSDARETLTKLDATHRPVAAVLITHPHPDHVGGLQAFHQVYPSAPIYANAASIEFIRDDPLKFYALTHQQLGDDAPAKPLVPDHTITADTALDVAGIPLQTAEFGPGESQTTVAYYQPDTGALFAGDVVGDHVTPALLEGHTCGWLTNLDQLTARFPEAITIYPGHGAPGPASALIGAQRDYLRTFRAVVRAAEYAGSPAGAQISAQERQSITAELDRRYPDYPRVASLPNLQDFNVTAVGAELSAETTTDLPAPCRP